MDATSCTPADTKRGPVESRRETWIEYVQRVTENVPRKDIAQAAEINVSGVSRWLTGATKRPSAEKAITFARGLGGRPVEALVAAGYLLPEEAAENTIRVRPSLRDFSSDQLMDELRRRISEA